MKRNSRQTTILLAILGSMIIFGACTPAKNVVYFQNLQKDTNIPMLDSNFELKIRKNDLLNISIISPDPVSTPLFNGVQNTAATLDEPGGKSGDTGGGYLVDQSGNIIIYKLGAVHAEGLTRNELKTQLQRMLVPYLKDAVVTVRFLSNHVTILGEVAHPQVITMPSEKLTLLEALGMSGDVTITGRKDNILVIRDNPTGKQLKRINLTDKSIFSSPFYYLRPDDVVYVEPSQIKIKNSGDAPQTIGYVLTGISIAITLLLNLLR